MSKRILLFAIFLLSCQTSFSQNSRDAIEFQLGQSFTGVKAIALGDAFNSVADDYSAMYWNPAGLTQEKKITLAFSGRYISVNTGSIYASKHGQKTSNDIQVNNLSLIFPYPVFRGSLVFSVAYGRGNNYLQALTLAAFDTHPNDYKIEYQYSDGTKITPFYMENIDRSEDIDQRGSLDKWSFGVALDISPEMALGISLHLISGQMFYQNNYAQSDVLDLYNDPALGQDVDVVSGTRSLDYNISGYDLTIGALVRPGNDFRIGFNAQIPLNFSVEEKYSDLMSIIFDDPLDIPITNDEREKSSANYSYEYPVTFSLGISKLFGPLLLTSQADFQKWSDFSSGGGEDSQLSDVFFIRFGGEYSISQFLFLRAGYYTVNNPIDNVSRYPRLHVYSIGSGFFVTKKLAIDIALTYSNRNFISPGDDILPQNADIEEKIINGLFELNYRF